MLRTLALLCTISFTACNGGQHAGSSSVGPDETLQADQLGTTKQLSRLGDVYLAGQPAAADFELFRERGVRTVLDTRHDAETPELNERTVVEDLGMQYVHVPWNGPDEMTDELIDGLRAVLVDAERPLLFHCASANRVGAVWMTYRVLDEGVPLEAALEEAKQIGMRTPAYEEKAIDYVLLRQ